MYSEQRVLQDEGETVYLSGRYFAEIVVVEKVHLTFFDVQHVGAAAAEIDAILRGAGWSPAAPATPSFALYQRRTATFAVLTQPGDTPGTTRLTLLQRLGQAP